MKGLIFVFHSTVRHMHQLYCLVLAHYIDKSEVIKYHTGTHSFELNDISVRFEFDDPYKFEGLVNENILDVYGCSRNNLDISEIVSSIEYRRTFGNRSKTIPEFK